MRESKTGCGRRDLLLGTVMLPLMSRPAAAETAGSLVVSVRSPFMCSGVAVAQDGAVFVGLPRFPGMEDSFSVGLVGPDGTPRPFPGGEWNGWRPGKDGTAAFVMVNAVHIFADGTLWVVDQGAPPGAAPLPGAQKLVQLDTRNGKVIRILRFTETILPKGAQFNDLRIHGDLLLVTDSGLGGVIIHDLKTGRTLRRLSGQAVMRNDGVHLHRGTGGRILKDGHGRRAEIQSDQLEVDAAGLWFYFSVPAGPLKKIRIADLLDTTKSDAELAEHVRVVAEIPSIGGTCIDTLDNIFLADAEHGCITVLAPDGRRAILTSDPRMISPDALFIDNSRRLWIPCSQIQELGMFNGGQNATRAPFLVLSMPLPERCGAITLGSAVGGISR